jgi:metallophosphoesterase superfamily enzyme
MPTFSPSQVYVAGNVLLDGRLAIFHERQNWLAVADLHFGYELSQRATGNLFPLWGMQSIEDRLAELLRDYDPKRLILLGDLVHDGAASSEFFSLIARLRKSRDVVLIAGNHDRQLRKIAFQAVSAAERLARREQDRLEARPPSQARCPTSDADLVESWVSDGFYFHHGHCASEQSDVVQIIGHHHPAGTIRDGAGLRLKLPAFVQEGNCWILPAFSPWAAGTEWNVTESSEVWLCSPQRVVRIASCNADSASP